MHDHWADANTSKAFVQDILVPYYHQCCDELGLEYGKQKCILLVDCWWGWLDQDFRKWLHDKYPWILEVFVPARCTPVAQPDDAGIIAMLKGDFSFLSYIQFKG